LMRKTKGVSICAVVKANAYGHDAQIITRVLSGQGVSFWGVASPQEAIELRQFGLRKPILVFRPIGCCGSEREMRKTIDIMRNEGIRATIASERAISLLAKGSMKKRKCLYAHIKVDTGMGRNGCKIEETMNLVVKASRIPDVKLEGIYSHFATADEYRLNFAKEQLAAFKLVLNKIEHADIHFALRHMANSGAIFNLPESWFDMIRPGLALYGYAGRFIRGSKLLKPVLRLQAPIILTKWLKKGDSCGYGCTFIAKKRMRIGLLPLGYADGYSRHWSNSGQVDINGRLAKVIGRISMDLTAIDLTNFPDANVGSSVCVISDRREAPHSVESMANKLGTVPHEITSILGRRIRRIMVE